MFILTIQFYVVAVVHELGWLGPANTLLLLKGTTVKGDQPTAVSFQELDTATPFKPNWVGPFHKELWYPGRCIIQNNPKARTQENIRSKKVDNGFHHE